MKFSGKFGHGTEQYWDGIKLYSILLWLCQITTVPHLTKFIAAVYNCVYILAKYFISEWSGDSEVVMSSQWQCNFHLKAAVWFVKSNNVWFHLVLQAVGYHWQSCGSFMYIRSTQCCDTCQQWGSNKGARLTAVTCASTSHLSPGTESYSVTGGPTPIRSICK